MPEKQNIEYKSSWHDDYLKWVCGFANAVGGKIFIGKDDNGNVVHLDDYKRLLESIPQKIQNTMGITCDVNLQEEDNKKFIEIIVNPYSVPVSIRGRYYYRSGSTKTELAGIELNEFLLKKAGKTWDDVIEERATIDDIDTNSITKYIEDAKDSDRLPDVEGLSTMQFLEKLRLIENGKIKRAAIVLFGKDPARFYPGISVRIGRFVDDDADLRFHDVFEGNIVNLLEEVIKQLGYKYLVKQIEFRGILRIEKGEYPLEAIREMLLNALVHRTYMGVHVQIRVYNDKIMIWNEGGLPYNMDIEMLKGVHNSHPRNQLIADACFKAGYIDTWGRGTLKIINSCKKAGLPAPEIIEITGGIQVTLFKESSDELKNTPQVAPQVIPQVTPQVEKLLEVIDNECNRKLIQDRLGLSDKRNVNDNYLQPALKLKLVEMTIPDKPNSSKQKYRLTKEGIKLKESLKN